LQPIQRFYDSAARNPDAVALAGTVDGDVTYATLRRRVDAVAAKLQAIDGTPGSRVGICAWNTAEHLTALLATYAAGKVWVPLNPRNGRADLDAMIAATKPTILVADDSCTGRFTRTSAPLITGSDIRTFQHEDATPARIDRNQEDAQIIKFSGGSTGAPKAVVQSLRCVNAQADGLRDFFAFAPDDVNLIAAPLTHGASCFVLPMLEVGARHVLLTDAKPRSILDAIAVHGVTTMYSPPTLLYGLIEGVEQRIPGTESLRHVIYSAAPMSPERIRHCQRALGPCIETAYGQVEAPQIITAMRADELLRDENLTSVGRASSVATVGIADGEIVVRGPLLMSGYLDRPEETAKAIVDGWLHTGDVGMIDERGYLFIHGRLRETINTGGFKVFPGDVENVLSRHAAVAECAVFAVEDAKWGEAVCAAVVVHAGANVSAEELIDFVKAASGSVKAPKRIWFVDHLERNAAGKVSRAAVRARVLS
jgi:fatty-acyl-CoA synthase